VKTLIWFRGKDLRVSDHPAFEHATNQALMVFVLDPAYFTPDRAQTRPHRMQYLVESLLALEQRIADLGGKLWFVAGRSADVIPKLAKAASVDQVVAMRWAEPFGRKRDGQLARALEVPLVLLEGETLLPPGSIRSQADTPYTVFSPFARRFRSQFELKSRGVEPAELSRVALPDGFKSVPCPTLGSLGLVRNSGLVKGGEQEAKGRLALFLEQSAHSYSDLRNRLDFSGTSRISADLKFGVLSVRQVWAAVMESSLSEAEKTCFTNELIWREFNYSTMWDHPDILGMPFKRKWKDFPWKRDRDLLGLWKAGLTGYPVVDAASRQLLATGFVHNRARMVAASFLTKHLLLDYRLGESHYLRWLTDGDWAQNSMGWQWAAGCGADAQPWFRIFNPVTQGKKFDPNGDYVRRWVPELSGVDAKYIHSPWEAPQRALEWAGVHLGETYPEPVVDHRQARERFLRTAKAFFSDQPVMSEEGTSSTSFGGSGDEFPATSQPA